MPPRGTTFVSKVALVVFALVASSCSDSTAPPKATGLRFVTAPPAIAETMVPLTIHPVLQTVDAQGNPVGASTTITVSVYSGLGQIEAGATATTNENGVATFSNLTLGVVTGIPEHTTLQFAAPGLQPVTSDVDLHCAVLPLAVPQTVSRSLTTGDCSAQDWGYLNEFLLPTTQPVTAVQLTLEGAFPGDLMSQGPHERGNFWGYGAPTGAVDNKFSYKVLLPPGETYVRISSDQPAFIGSYTLTTAAAPEDLTCDFTAPVAASPIASVQKLGPGDCAQNSFLEDFLVVGLSAQATLTASMTSSAFNPAIELLDGSTGGLEKSSTGQGSTSLTFTNTGSGAAYYLMFTSSVPGASGAYNFSLNIAYPSGSAARAALKLGAPVLLPRNLIPFHPAQRAH